MEEAAPKPLSGLDQLGGSPRLSAPGIRPEPRVQDRLVKAFCVVSALLHGTILVLGPFSWAPPRPPVSEEWSMDADLLSDVVDPVVAKTALPEAAKAPEAKVRPDMLPQITKTFSIKEATKPEEAVADVKEPEKPAPKEAKPAPTPEATPTPNVTTQPEKKDNQLEEKEALKRLALERLRQLQKVAPEVTAPEQDPLARVYEQVAKNSKLTGAVAAAGAKGRVQGYLARVNQVVRRNYSVPGAYDFQSKNLQVLVDITLAESGQLTDLTIRESSGNSVFDDVTVQAVRASVPLPKPPTELVGVPLTLRFTPQTLQ